MLKHTLDTLKLVAKAYPKFLMYKLFGVPRPVLVSFGITNRCNLRCDYCFLMPQDRINKELPTEKLLDYIDQFIDLGAAQINLQGGEPSMHPDLGKFISRIVERGAICTISTNGFRADKHLEDFKKCYSVCVSLDGSPETTNLHRGKGTYEMGIRALEVMAASGINVRIHGVLTMQTTFADINHLVELAKRYRTNVNFVYALDTGVSITGCDDKKGFSEHIRKIVSHILELKGKRGIPITSKRGAIRQVLNWPCGSQDILIEKEMTEEQKKDMKKLLIPKCLWGHLACFFNPDGKLYICPRAFDREGYFVEIGNRTIREAFYELARLKPCYMCGQMDDLSYSLKLGFDNIRTWLRWF